MTQSLSRVVPIEGQSFSSEQDWINRATRCLTSHPEYRNTEHDGGNGWRGPHFTALCFDQAGNRMRNGGDFQRATREGTYPVWWIWPDQIVNAIAAPAPDPASGLWKNLSLSRLERVKAHRAEFGSRLAEAFQSVNAEEERQRLIVKANSAPDLDTLSEAVGLLREIAAKPYDRGWPRRAATAFLAAYDANTPSKGTPEVSHD